MTQIEATKNNGEMLQFSKKFNKLKLALICRPIMCLVYYTYPFFSCWVNALLLHFSGCPNKHGNSVTNSISSLLWISIVIPNFKSHNIFMSARVYFMKTVNGCKYLSVKYLQDKKWRRTSLLCLYTVQPYAVKT